MSNRSRTAIPVGRPLLPSADAVAKYLALIDRSRCYTNRGELVGMLELRLADLFKSPACIVSAASGTAALTGAILAATGRATASRPLCLCAGYNFVATAQAAQLCGYRVRLVDVDALTWALDPDALAENQLLDRQVGVVVVTAPYGRRFSQKGWERFRDRTGVPVVVDAAAGIEALADDAVDLIGTVPVVLSLHATKAFGVGEGGAIVCADRALARAALAALNFGFDGTREVAVPGLNGKMSEYHAAVGLAELDGWSEKRAALRRVAESYRRSAAHGGLTIHVAPQVSSCYALLSSPDGLRAGAALTHEGIDHRLWYGRGLHREPYFATDYSLPVVDTLASRLIGLPVAPDLPDAVIERIVAILAGGRA